MEPNFRSTTLSSISYNLWSQILPFLFYTELLQLSRTNHNINQKVKFPTNNNSSQKYLILFQKNKYEQSYLLLYSIKERITKSFFLPSQFQKTEHLLSIAMEKYLFLLSTSPINSLFTYYFQTNNWKQYPFPNPREGPSILQLPFRNIGIIGGIPETQEAESDCSYFSIHEEWYQLPKLLQKVRYSSACLVNSQFIYLINGMKKIGKYSDTIQRLNFASQQKWKIIKYRTNSSEWIPFYGHNSVQINSNSVLVFGGADNYGYLNANFRYNFVKKKISYMSSTKKSIVQSPEYQPPIILDNYLYSIDKRDQNDIFIYNISSNEWKLILKKEWYPLSYFYLFFQVLRKKVFNN